MELKELFEKFIREREYVNNLAPNTLKSYRASFIAWGRFKGELSEDGLMEFVIAMRHEGKLQPGACNVYIRSLNAFFNWLYQNHHLEEHYRLPLVGTQQKIIPIFSDDDIQRILRFRPKDFYEWRMWAICNTLLDTGMRVSECLNLKRQDIDWNDLLLTITVKGRGQRRVPFSPELRRVLYQYLQKRDGIDLNGEWMFPTVGSTKINYRNFHRDMFNFCKRLKISGVRISPHSFRHFFAANFIKQGGEIYTLSRLLGHSAVSVTEVYLRSIGVEHLQQNQIRFTPLGRR